VDNPFSFSGVVNDPAFCNRQKEQAELTKLIKSSQNVLLYSHRRFGKTSLILKVFSQLKTATPIYVDLYGTTSIPDFISAFLTGISAAEPKTKRLLKLVRETITSFTATVGIDPVTGLPTISPQLTPGQKPAPLEEVFKLAEAVSTRKKIAIAFDEFQEVASYGGDAFEKKLRKCIQQHQNIAYIFSGSQKHLITEMFSNAKRAFYRQAASFPLRKIAIEEYSKWVTDLYRKDGRSIDSKRVAQIVRRCEGHPAYIQEFLYHLWAESEISNTVIDQTERRIIRSRFAEFAYAWDSLTLNQRRALKLIVATGGKGIYAVENLARFGFRTPSQANAAVDKLIEREFLVKNGVYQVQDPIFKRWLATSQAGN
jgi:AAA+ ATPase superfamily predicted ATPase